MIDTIVKKSTLVKQIKGMIIVNQDDTGKGLFYINKGTIVLMQNEKINKDQYMINNKIKNCIFENCFKQPVFN